MLKTINDTFKAQIDIKKSNFLAFLTPFENFKTMHESLKQEHPKAVHIVWAYRVMNKYGQIVENQSDDGEPKGTSGPPALNALRGANLINSAILIVRYFGGIKLGTGGLVRAYSTATNLAINEAILIDFIQKESVVFFTNFSLISRFEHYFQTNNIFDIKKDFNEKGAKWEINLTMQEFLNLHNFLKTIQTNDFEFLALPIHAKDSIN
ncbi:IMPACT family protein [Campylobacter pinnipediorum]|uniref:IMPACT family protein n=1 Tax=Campylobacter pinnipediorum TaxID=1965231 RepID=UPI0009949904|nr:YigZ family protein [Campylobacter pinnipediorum]AQW81674.1 putative UPF0029 domain protein [Campylobacter pinnipediorum subsp. pinnipediorum]AQW83303.1 putative UPF0029 domain protein [Campylobacter pinnipediorum subsp. pinnipediorum]